MRITGGAFRSRTLVAPAGRTTRPTSDRVREALFSLLSARVSLDGVDVLDLYAGTGCLALEALSRGARSATLVEKDPQACKAIQKNFDALGVPLTLLSMDVARAIVKLENPFDLVFADPPYADVDAFTQVAAALSPLVRGFLVLEHAKRTATPELRDFSLSLRRDYGDTALSIYEASKADSVGVRSARR